MAKVRDWQAPLPFTPGAILTPEAVEFLARLIAEVKQLRAQVDDHETRITALEP